MFANAVGRRMKNPGLFSSDSFSKLLQLSVLSPQVEFLCFLLIATWDDVH